MPKKPKPKPWKRVIAFICMFIAMCLSIGALILPWSRRSRGGGKWALDLWWIRQTYLNINGEPNRNDLEWDTLCKKSGKIGERDDDSQICSRIKAGRAFMLLSMIFDFGTGAFLLLTGALDTAQQAYFCYLTAVIMAFHSCVFIIAAIGIGISFCVEFEGRLAEGLVFMIIIVIFCIAGMSFACWKCYALHVRKAAGKESDKGKFEKFGGDDSGGYNGWGNWRPQGQPVLSNVHGQGHVNFGQHPAPNLVPPQPYGGPSSAPVGQYATSPRMGPTSPHTGWNNSAPAGNWGHPPHPPFPPGSRPPPYH